MKRGLALVLLAGVSFASEPAAPPAIWAKKGAYPPRPGNDVQMLVDGQASYAAIAESMKKARKFLYATISYGDVDFMPVPETGGTIFDLYRAAAQNGADVKLVVWDPTTKIDDTIPDPAPKTIPGVNEGPGSVKARWDKAGGYLGWYRGVHMGWRPFPLWFPAAIGCNHQKTYVMDDGQGGVVAYVGGINPVQAYWDTQAHDALDTGRVAKGTDPVGGLKKVPPLHDVFYKIAGPSAGDVIANFVERYNGASEKKDGASEDAQAPVKPEEIAPVEGGVEAQILRTIPPHKYKTSRGGDTGIKEMYLNALNAAAKGTIVYIENQYFFDHVIIDAIHDAAERGAKIICLLTSKPDEGTPQGTIEGFMEKVAKGETKMPGVTGHQNVAIMTLGNSRPDPKDPSQVIASETYIHSKNMYVLNDRWAAATGGSANIAFTSMLFHAEENVAVNDPERTRQWVARLWAEHLGISEEKARELAKDPEAAFEFFKTRSGEDLAALERGRLPASRVYPWGTKFPDRKLPDVDPGEVKAISAQDQGGSASFDLPAMHLSDVRAAEPAPAPVAQARAARLDEAMKADTLINLGEFSASDEERCRQAGRRCVQAPFDAAFARAEDKENLVKAFQAAVRERAEGRTVSFDPGIEEERSAAVEAALRVRQETCGKAGVDKDKLWSSLQDGLQHAGFDPKYKLLGSEIQGWALNPEREPWLCSN